MRTTSPRLECRDKARHGSQIVYEGRAALPDDERTVPHDER